MNEELIRKAKEAKNVEELLAMAEENEITLTKEQAADYFAKLTPPMGELSDDELDNVAGGVCAPNPLIKCKFKVGDHVMYNDFTTCGESKGDNCPSPYLEIQKVSKGLAWPANEYEWTIMVHCPVCGMHDSTVNQDDLHKV